MADLATTADAVSLPVPRTRLIGRERERATARALLIDEAAPLLTLTGPGGSGKTRLALAIAQDVAADFSDGVAWVDFAPLADPSLLPAIVAQSLGIIPVADLPVAEQLVRELRARQSLVLLDNCEHVLEGASSLAATLLAACPAVQILATSRAPLRHRGEQELPVEPFPLPPPGARADDLATNAAVRLFSERAHAVSPGFALNDANVSIVAEICRRLDGLPLAIELAAARMKVLSAEALLALLGDRLRLLRGGSRDLPARQQTIRGTIAWSYTLLDPAQQMLFRHLSVFVGGWTLEAAVAIADDSATVHDLLDGIGVLADHSLVRQIEGSSGPRYTMLETIREFGLAELAASGEEPELRSRHAGWCRSMVESLDLHHTMQRDATRMGLLVPEQDNIRQALAWFALQQDAVSLNVLSAAMSIFWPSIGHFAEARTWLEQACALDTDVPVLIRARIWHEAGWLAMCQGELEIAKPLHDRGLALAREAGEPYLLAEAILSAGTLAFWQGDLARAAALMAEGREAFQALTEEFATAPLKAAAAVIFLNNIAFVAGDLPLASQRGEEAVAITRALGASAEYGYALCGLGYARLLDGAATEAAAYFLEATALTWAAGDDAFLARLLWAMAAVATTIERSDLAARLVGAADVLDARTGSAMWPADEVIASWCVTRIETILDPATFASLRHLGTALTVDQAVALAKSVAAMTVGEERATRVWQRTGAREPHGGEEVLAGPLQAPTPSGPTEDDVLTRPERDVLVLMGQRLSDADIAARLVISPRMVDMLVAEVLVKLGVTNRRDAAAAIARLDDDPTVASIHMANYPRDGETRATLTPRELDVLRHLSAGRTDREIAEILFISRRTASKHVEAILAKLGVRSRGAAAAEARRLELTPTSPSTRRG